MRPTHPSGFQAADDSPAFIAPALELRRAVEATIEGEVESAVAFTLAFPIVERQRVPEPESEPDEKTDEHDTTSPETEQFEGNDTLQDMPVIDPESTVERDPYKDSGEITLLASEQQTLLQSLSCIGPFDDLPDLGTQRPPQARVLLARARAMRFRLALLDLWPEDHMRASALDDELDLALHPAIVVALAGGAPVDGSGRSPSDVPVAAALVDEVRSRHPDVVRATLRDAAAAAYARVTLLGTERAIDYVKIRFGDYPAAVRRDAVALATRVAGSARPDSPAAIALARLREALQGA